MCFGRVRSVIFQLFPIGPIVFRKNLKVSRSWASIFQFSLKYLGKESESVSTSIGLNR